MSFKKYALGLLLLLPWCAFSQTIDDIGKIMLSVQFSSDVSDETKALQSQLQSKLVGFATQAGYSSYGNNTFFVSPNVVVNTTDVAEGGMKNVYVVRGDLCLTIKDNTTGTIFASASLPFKGSGTKRESAVRSAVLAINYSGVSAFFGEARSKILSYYETRQEALFARADLCAANGQYDEAIAYLMLMPEELTNLYLNAIEKAKIIYSQRDEAERQRIINERYDNNAAALAEANNLLAMHQPEEALKRLWSYQHGDAQQDEQYSSLIAKAEGLITEFEREQLRIAERDYQDNKEREQRQWEETVKDNEHQRNIESRKLDLQEETLEATERLTLNKMDLEAERIVALKEIACEYIRNNPNYVYSF